MTRRNDRPRRRRAFTLVELLIVFGIIAVLMAMLLATIEVVRHQGYIAKCAANLHAIGQALAIYSNENHGNYPRTRYVAGAPPTAGTGGSSPDTFGPTGPQPNDLSAAINLLVRTQKTGTEPLICPYNDVTTFSPDSADPTNRSNFTDYKTNLGYSIANPYPDSSAEEKGYRWISKLPTEFAVAADLNPAANLPGLTPQSSTRDLARANSRNHEGDGQNVLYCDGHVSWEKSVFAGVKGDNVYANRAGQINASPIDKDDSVLLPTR